MSMVPVTSTTASLVLSLAVRTVATPSRTARSATAQRSCTSLSSPNSLPITMLPTLSAARSSSSRLRVPSRTYSRASPLLVPSHCATELPWPFNAMAPSSRPRLLRVNSTSGNKAASRRFCTRVSMRTVSGRLRLSSTSFDSILPLATPKCKGSRRSTASSSTACTLRSSSGRLSGRITRCPENFRSMSMLLQRSVAKAALGNTLPLRPAGAFAVVAVPSTGPRSASRNWLDVMAPDSLPRGAPDTKRRLP